MKTETKFAFDDAAIFDQSLASFSNRLNEIDSTLGPTLSAALPKLADEAQDIAQLLTELWSAIIAEQPVAPATVQSPLQQSPVPSGVGGSEPPIAPPGGSAPIRWFLDAVEIEGFRGINNENSPLSLKFKTDSVNSISAPNGVGKSSIFDALSFAFTGKIPKLDRLLQAERPQDYYVNKFHPGGMGTVKLTLRPDNDGEVVAITITCSTSGARTVVSPAGVDGGALLAQLNREFVLLDAHTFRNFIDHKALERGRAFSGLLGLARYSVLRQQLQALSNTRTINTHFNVTAHNATKAAADRAIQAANLAIAKDYESLVKEVIGSRMTVEEAQKRCQAALHGIPVLTDYCANRPFMEVDIGICIDAIKMAEGGPKRDRLAEVIREQAKWSKANKVLPTETDLPSLTKLATAREEVLKATSGELLHELYRLSEKVMAASDWPTPTLCPVCDRDDGSSIQDVVRVKLRRYDAVDTASAAVSHEWADKGWGELADLEVLAPTSDEEPLFKRLSRAGEAGTLSSTEAVELATRVSVMRERAKMHLTKLAEEKATLEKELPPSLVAVTTAVEAARRLQGSWRTLAAAEAESAEKATRANRVVRLKTYLDSACSLFATAESDLAKERLKKVQPLCQDLFKDIMFSPVVPALEKPVGSEELVIKLAEFWGLKDLSAQALLSESFRNGFAVSVYLAAASLYGGAPRFVILDDVTSSFDAGHQHHIVEVIRNRFARPLRVDGPQVILLSHDTLLEKLFNKHSESPEWWHQRLEGTARTAVLPQSGAVNKVRDATIDLLNAGRVDDAAPRIRQYLEYTLHNVIDRCRIPVSLDLAFGDDKRTPGEYLKAIHAAVDLNEKAQILVLDAAQVQALGMHSTAIISNFLSHWSTGQSQAFSAPALLGVMQAIDAFPDCFKYEPVPGAPRKFYSSLNKR